MTQLPGLNVTSAIRNIPMMNKYNIYIKNILERTVALIHAGPVVSSSEKRLP